MQIYQKFQDLYSQEPNKKPEVKENTDRHLNQGPLLYHQEHQGDLVFHKFREPDPGGGQHTYV